MPRPYHYIVFKGRVAFALLFAGSAEGHALIQRHIVADDRGLSDDDAAPVVNKKPFSDGRPGVDLNAGLAGPALGNPSGPEIMSLKIQFVGDPVPEDHTEARIKEYFHV